MGTSGFVRMGAREALLRDILATVMAGTHKDTWSYILGCMFSFQPQGSILGAPQRAAELERDCLGGDQEKWLYFIMIQN